MTDVLANVGTFLASKEGSSITGLLKGASQVYSGVKASSQQDALFKQQQDLYKKYQADSDPANTVKGIMALKQPLTEGMRKAISDSISAELAGKGLSGSSGIFQELFDKAIAQMEMQLMSQAESAYFNSKKLPLDAFSTMSGAKPASMTGIAGAGNVFDAITKAYAANATKDTGLNTPGAGSGSTTGSAPDSTPLP